MRVTLRYFASVREALGRREEQREVAAGTTLDTLWQALVTEQPRLAGLRVRPAVNQEYVARDTVLHDGDEVAFIPPVSGGRPRWS